MVIRTIDLRDVAALTVERVEALLPRAQLGVEAAVAAAQPLLDAIAERGAEALAEQAERFDGVVPPSWRVPAPVVNEALARLARPARDAMELAIERVRRVHAAQVPPGGRIELAAGATVTQRWIPVRRAGLYAPGGLAAYPSSVIMNVVPAQEAGVRELALASPPLAAQGGWPHPAVLAACALLGVEEIYAVGGVSAIGLFAYGVPGVARRTDVITGPGNVYVAAAKRLVMGRVGIDSEAGPTEIAIVADGGANAEFVAADLISQAEHDPLAGAVLITDSPDLAAQVGAALERRSAATFHAERVRAALGGGQSGIVLVNSVADAIEVANIYAAEHLELQVADPAAAAGAVHSAGAIFVGPYSPVPLGDYVAGSNHVLPTGGTARFASGLGVTAFLKSVQQVEYSPAALHDVADPITAFANVENLPAHGEAVQVRRPAAEPGSLLDAATGARPDASGGALPGVPGSGSGGALPGVPGSGSGAALPGVPGSGSGAVLPGVPGSGSGAVLPGVPGSGSGAALPGAPSAAGVPKPAGREAPNGAKRAAGKAPQAGAKQSGEEPATQTDHSWLPPIGAQPPVPQTGVPTEPAPLGTQCFEGPAGPAGRGAAEAGDAGRTGAP
ncbi:MAG: histidinol dehydrogenase [Bifidobacteriaceae bacterium]|jgi:histidinol dehydrogenase|nr:histidinol dehydrogenase [Bifidobacteriaceae bacterium]